MRAPASSLPASGTGLSPAVAGSRKSPTSSWVASRETTSEHSSGSPWLCARTYASRSAGAASRARSSRFFTCCQRCGVTRAKPSSDLFYRARIRAQTAGDDKRPSTIIRVMASDQPHEVTVLLEKWSLGDRDALDELMPLIYSELRRLAGSHFRRERADHTLQSTAVVHEAFMRLAGQREVRWQNRAHFYGIAAQMIRRILLDYARAHRAGKRGSGAVKLQLDEAIAVPERNNVEIVALNDALDRLSAMDERQARIV